MKEHMAKFDHDGNGKLSEKEFELYKENETLKANLAKQNHQASLAWTAMVAMLAFTVVMFMPFVDPARVETLTNMSDLFYIAQAGIVGAYMGVTAWMQRK